MVAMRNLVSAKYPDIHVLGCAANGLNLLICDIAAMDRYKPAADKAKAVVKEVNIVKVLFEKVYFVPYHSNSFLQIHKSAIKSALFNDHRQGNCNQLQFFTKTRWVTDTQMYILIIHTKIYLTSLLAILIYI